MSETYGGEQQGITRERLQAAPDRIEDAGRYEGADDSTDHALEPSQAVSDDATRPVSPFRNRGTWLPGQSGNPNGRPPKGQTLTDRLKAKASAFKHGDVSRVNADDLIDAVWALALSGESHAVRAAEMIFDRTDGKVTIPVEVAAVTLVLPADADVP